MIAGPTNTEMNPDDSDFAKIIKSSLALLKEDYFLV